MDILNYKGYEGTAEVDMSSHCCRGKLLFIDDLVTYEAETPAGLQREFELAVDDYLETCASVGKEPQRPFKGLFNVRISPDLHRSAALRAVADGVFLNEVVVAALKHYLATRAVHKVAAKVVDKPEDHFKALATRSSSSTQWKKVTGVSRGN